MRILFGVMIRSLHPLTRTKVFPMHLHSIWPVLRNSRLELRYPSILIVTVWLKLASRGPFDGFVSWISVENSKQPQVVPDSSADSSIFFLDLMVSRLSQWRPRVFQSPCWSDMLLSWQLLDTNVVICGCSCN